MIFDGHLNELTSEEIVGLLSCFIHKEPSKEDNTSVHSKNKNIPSNLQSCIKQLLITGYIHTYIPLYIHIYIYIYIYSCVYM
jgi:superfamily II RNA helicase